MPEAAGIARAKVKDICDGQAEDFEALIVSGGFGAAKNLSDFAVNGSAMAVQWQCMTAQADFLSSAQ